MTNHIPCDWHPNRPAIGGYTEPDTGANVHCCDACVSAALYRGQPGVQFDRTQASSETLEVADFPAAPDYPF